MNRVKSISLFATALLISGFIIFTFAEKSYSGVAALGCCLIAPDVCTGCGDLECALNRDMCAQAGGDGDVPGSICVDGTCESAQGTGCCVVDEEECQEDIGIETCDRTFEGQAWFRGVSCNEVSLCGQQPSVSNVPSLSQWGLIAMAVILGIVGFYVIRRKKATV